MKTYPLEALRRLHADRADGAGAVVAARLRAATAAEQERRRQVDDLAHIDQRVTEEQLPGAVVDLRALARLGAHRTRLRIIRAEAAARLAEATVRLDAAQEALAEARSAQRVALRAREAVHAHRRGWQQDMQRARDRAEEVVMDELAIARWRAPASER